ncbi:hypothetical protein [Novosphingobium sp.]|uniref:hypothetical protein n=1 Tax=Novosphingobium sp. TaxID=1874826 RepID=UPI003341CE9A
MAVAKSWGWAGLPILATIGLLTFAPQWGVGYRGVTFVGVMVIVAVELAVIGALVNGRPIGAFIDNRNRISLSKLQAGAWTVVVLAALATAAAFNMVAPDNGTGYVTALAVTIPGDLLLAMGISATSLVASPALLSLKAGETPSTQAVDQAAIKMNRTDGTDVPANGKVAMKALASEASWADLVTGEEVGNVGYPDLGKIQQVLITALLLGCYTAYIYTAFSRTTTLAIHSLPLLDTSFVGLLALSHGTYLAYKAVPHTGTGKPAPQTGSEQV